VILGGGVVAGCLFTFVVTSRGHLCDCTAFLLNKNSVECMSENDTQQTKHTA